MPALLRKVERFLPVAAAQIRVCTAFQEELDHVQLTGGGPTGIVLDEPRSRLYVLTRFDNSVSIVSTGTGMETDHVPLYNPEPASVVNGRRFLYDARLT